MANFRDVCFLIKLLEHGFFAWQYWALQMQEIIMERWHHWLLDGLRPLLECLLAPVQGKIFYHEVTFPKNLHSEVQSIQHVTSDLGVWPQSSGEQDHSLDGLMIILIISGGIQLLGQWLVVLLVSYSFKTFKWALLKHGRQHLKFILMYLAGMTYYFAIMMHWPEENQKKHSIKSISSYSSDDTKLWKN